jgi:hypothetical protein
MKKNYFSNLIFVLNLKTKRDRESHTVWREIERKYRRDFRVLFNAEFKFRLFP